MDMGKEARRLRVEEQLTIAQIKDRLGVSRATLEGWLRGIPAPEWTKRPTAKDDLRARAVELRLAGHWVPSIARELGSGLVGRAGRRASRGVPQDHAEAPQSEDESAP